MPVPGACGAKAGCVAPLPHPLTGWLRSLHAACRQESGCSTQVNLPECSGAWKLAHLFPGPWLRTESCRNTLLSTGHWGWGWSAFHSYTPEASSGSSWGLCQPRVAPGALAAAEAFRVGARHTEQPGQGGRRPLTQGVGASTGWSLCLSTVA